MCDDKTVTAEDLGSNFFVCPDRVGTARAVAVTDLLCELNPDVKVLLPHYMRKCPLCTRPLYKLMVVCTWKYKCIRLRLLWLLPLLLAV